MGQTHPERRTHSREHHLGEWTGYKPENQKEKSQNTWSSNMQDHLSRAKQRAFINEYKDHEDGLYSWRSDLLLKLIPHWRNSLRMSDPTHYLFILCPVMNGHVKICILLLDISSFSNTRNCLGDVSDRPKNPLLFLAHLWKILSNPSRSSLWLDEQRAQLTFKAHFWIPYWNHFQSSTHISLVCQTLQTGHKGTSNIILPSLLLLLSALRLRRSQDQTKHSDKVYKPITALARGSNSILLPLQWVSNLFWQL